MPEQVTYSDINKTIHVKSTGNVIAEEIKQSLIEVIRIETEKGYRKVLVDQSEAFSIPNDVTAFNFGSELAYSFKGMSIAIIQSELIKDDLEFIEKVAQVRGGNLKIFNTDFHINEST